MNQKNTQISTVNFYDHALSVIDKEGEEYVAMRPIVEGIGLSWSTQQGKLINNKAKFNCVHINTVGKDNKNRDMLCNYSG